MLAFLQGNPDEMAAVMGHEFSHLLLNHEAQRDKEYTNLTYWAKRMAQARYSKSGNASEANQQGRLFREIEFAKFSRETESEADEKGFSLAFTLAKFNGEGAKSLAIKFSKFPPSGRPPYLDSHPGWLERFAKADILTLNHSYINSAQTLLQKQNWKQLNSLVKAWLREIPTSGAAWYYQGRLLVRTTKSKSAITRAFEESATYYLERSALGTRSQEDQIEADDVWFQLCLALYDEGFKYESANCSLHIRTEEVRAEFEKRTFGGPIYVGGNEQAVGKFFVGRDVDGNTLITNDESLAGSHGLAKPFPPVWKAIRIPNNPQK